MLEDRYDNLFETAKSFKTANAESELKHFIQNVLNLLERNCFDFLLL